MLRTYPDLFKIAVTPLLSQFASLSRTCPAALLLTAAFSCVACSQHFSVEQHSAQAPPVGSVYRARKTPPVSASEQ